MGAPSSLRSLIASENDAPCRMRRRARSPPQWAGERRNSRIAPLSAWRARPRNAPAISQPEPGGLEKSDRRAKGLQTERGQEEDFVGVEGVLFVVPLTCASSSLAFCSVPRNEAG